MLDNWWNTKHFESCPVLLFIFVSLWLSGLEVCNCHYRHYQHPNAKDTKNANQKNKCANQKTKCLFCYLSFPWNSGFEILLRASSLSTEGTGQIKQLIISIRWVEVAKPLPISKLQKAPKRAIISSVTDFSWNNMEIDFNISQISIYVLTTFSPVFNIPDEFESIGSVPYNFVFHRATRWRSITQVFGAAKARNNHNDYQCREDFHCECAELVGPAILWNLLSPSLIRGCPHITLTSTPSLSLLQYWSLYTVWGSSIFPTHPLWSFEHKQKHVLKFWRTVMCFGLSLDKLCIFT